MSKKKIEYKGLTLTWNEKCSCYQFSLPPQTACPGVQERLKNPRSVCNYCYAKWGRSGQTKAPMRILRRNLTQVRNTPGWALLDRFDTLLGMLPEKTKFFRWLGCGDIAHPNLYTVMLQMALDYPDIQFWAPTQTTYPEFRRLPNMKIRHTESIMGRPAGPNGLTTLLPGQKNLPGHYLCPGKCGLCRICWNTSHRVAFPFHGNVCLWAKLNKARRVHGF